MNVDSLIESELVKLESDVASRRYSIKDQMLYVYNSWAEKDGKHTALEGRIKSGHSCDPYQDGYCMGDDIAAIPTYIKELLGLDEMDLKVGRLWRMNTGCRDINNKTIYVGDVLKGMYFTQSGAASAEWRGVALLPLYGSVEKRVCTVKCFGGAMFTLTLDGYRGSAGACGGHHLLEVIGDVFRSPALAKKPV